MGSGMVRNLAAAGHQVRLFTRTPSRAEGLPATVVPSIADAVDGADLACSCVTDSPDVVEVVTAMLAAPSPAPIVVEMSTIAPAVARELAERCAARGVAYLDCPVSGGPAGAAAGTLAIMCGGDAAAIARAAPALDAMGDPDKRVHCGPVGLGLVAKLVNNMLVASITVATAEALGAGQRAGLDPALAREVVMRSSGRLLAAAQPLPAGPGGRPRARLHRAQPAEGPRPRRRPGHRAPRAGRPRARAAGADAARRRLRRGRATDHGPPAVAPGGAAPSSASAGPAYFDCDSRTARSA